MTDTARNNPMLSSKTRRRFLKNTVVAGAAPLGIGAPAIAAARKTPSKIMVMGVDGMDPALTKKLIKEGRLPNCAKLARQGSFGTVGSTYPPQSPVAWSSFVSGTDPGGHGIFDFIARDPETRAPFLSTAKTSPPAKTLTFGGYSLPLGGGQTELLRQGPALWDILAEAGMDSTAFRAPVNFPAPKHGAKTLTGITTPDVQGSYGVFSWYTTDVNTDAGEVAGGVIQRIYEENGFYSCNLEGPVDPGDREGNRCLIPFKVYKDRENKTAFFEFPDKRFLLKEGEWSDWMQVSFPVSASLSGIPAICRLCLKRVDSVFEFYVSPFNIDPSDPVADISSPKSFAKELAEELGFFYTQGMPEDTAALSAGVFDDADFLEQSWFVLEERLRMLEHELNRYEEGFFYFYFSSLDLNSHAFWRAMDPGHPLYSDRLAREFGDVLPSMYQKIDQGIGLAMEHMDDDTLFMIVSDHGFVPFRSQFNLNTWLLDNGYSKLKNRFDREGTSYFANTKWTETRAYGLGINSLYLNVNGREDEGIVSAGDDFESLRTELIAKLEEVRDEESGEKVIRGVYRPEDIYSGPSVEMAPDLIVCYNQNFRASWDTILGGYPREICADNLDPWSGDHCMHPDFLSGVLISNQKHPDGEEQPKLWDLAPSILNLLDLEIPKEMTGRTLWS